jgi:hypothetical protein
MPILDPVSPFLALIDRLISLIRERKTRQRDYFEKIIDPLYTQFTPVGEDYLKLFRTAREAVNGPKRGRKSKLAEITAKREEFVATRVKLRTLLERCEKNAKKQNEDDLIAFLGAMLKFFAPTVTTTPVSSLGKELVDFFVLWTYGTQEAVRASRSDQKNAVELLRSAHSQTALHDDSTEALILYVAQATARLETSWYEIAGRYMELKLKYYSD